MPTVTYELGIPDANNNPSTDQPLMQSNNDAVDTILNVDLYAFNLANGGYHKQVTLPANNVPAAQTDPQSVIYSNTGAVTLKSEALFRNQNGIFPMSAVRAFANFNTVGGPYPAAVTVLNGFNISSITATGLGLFTVTLTANAVIGNNIMVLWTTSSGEVGSYTFANPTLTVSANSAGAPKHNFIILQM